MSGLLSKKQRSLHPFAQVKSLVTIGNRAMAKADHLEDLVESGSDLFGQAELDEAKALRAKAEQATDEILDVVRANPTLDWTLRQRRAAGIA